jgi:hypothetical protein
VNGSKKTKSLSVNASGLASRNCYFWRRPYRLNWRYP